MRDNVATNEDAAGAKFAATVAVIHVVAVLTATRVLDAAGWEESLV